MAVRSLSRKRGGLLWNRAMAIVTQREAPRNFEIRWLWLLGAIVLLAAGWGVFNAVQVANRVESVQVAPVPNVKVAQPVVGPIASSLAFTGDVKANAQVNVLSKATGRIERLAVDVGSAVKRGDVIAEIDSAIPKTQVAQAQAALDAAQAKYDNMKDGTRQEQLTQVKAAMDSARERVSAMEEGTREEQMAQAEAALKAVQAKETQVKKGAKDTDLGQLMGAMQAAEGQLKAAQGKLQEVKNGPTQADWGKALGAVDAARAQMKAAQARLDDVKAGPKQADFMAADAALTAAKAQLAAANDLKDTLDIDTSGAMGAINALFKGMAGATSDEKVGRQAAAAEAAVEAAQARMDLLHSYPLPADLQAATSAFDAAKANYEAAAATVDQMKKGATPEQLQQVEGATQAAEGQLAMARNKLQQAKDGATDEDMAMVEAAVTQADQQLKIAQKPFRDQELAQARNAVIAAQAQYQLASSPFTQHEMDMAMAAVHQAQSALDMAQIGLTETVVVSPIDGTVADKFQSMGSLISPQTPLVTLVSGDIELSLPVEESQIGQIKVGQGAELSVPAYPGKLFPAKVTAVAPAADPKNRSFQVKIKPEDPERQLMQGMFADVRIVTQQKEKALTVPKEAMVTHNGKSAVFVLKDGVAQLREVTVGLQTPTTVEVQGGVDPSEQVITAGHADLQDGDRVNVL